MKKIVSFIIICLSIMTLSVNAADLRIDGTYLAARDVWPIIEDNRTLVPVRAVAEQMGATVLWDDATQTVTINKPNEKITYQDKEYPNAITSAALVLGQKIITIGLTDETGTQVFSVDKEMDVAAKTIDGRTYIPARFVGYALGYDVTWWQAYGRVDYSYTGKQTLDFDSASDNTKKIDYEYDKEKYPDITVVSNVQWPSRKGYNGIDIIDVTASRMEGRKLINFFPYRFTKLESIIECDDEEYQVSNDKTREENFQAYIKFYEDKTAEIVNKTKWGSYAPVFLTNENCGQFSESEIYGESELAEYMDTTKKYYRYYNPYATYDFTHIYFVNEWPVFGAGVPWYGSKEEEILQRGSDKNALMFLNTFLGETGHRIWTMLHEYYTMTGYSYVPPETELEKPFVDEDGYHYPDLFPGASTETVEKYGLTVVDNIRMNTLSQLLTLKTDKQLIYVEYHLIDITKPFSYYTIYFEMIEN